MSSTISAIAQVLDALGRVPVIAGVLTKGSLLILLAVCLTRLLGRAPAAARHLVWSLSVAGLLLLPAISWMPWRLELTALASARDALTAPPPHAPTPSATSSPAVATPGPTTAIASIASPNATPESAADGTRSVSTLAVAKPDGAAAGITRRLRDPAAILLLVWLAGTIVMVGRLVTGIASVRWMVRDAETVDGHEWRLLVDRARAAIGAKSAARIVISERAAMPFTYGVVRPVIVLPASAKDWATERRQSVLMHELAHVRRLDLVTNAVVQLACAVYWFHPLIHLAARRVRIEAERACDALVVNAGKLPSEYAGDLLEIARTMRSSATGAVALAMARRSDFEGRLLAILAPDAGRNMLTAARAALIAIAFAAPAVAVAAAVPARSAPPNAVEDVRTHGTESSSGGTDAVESPAVASTATEEAAQSTERQAEPRQAQGRDAAVPALLTVVRDENASVRLAAVEALGQLADPRAIDALAEVLRSDSDPRVREAAASALGSIESPRAVPALISALGSERVLAVRAKIAWALGEIEDPRAVDALGNALRDPAIEVRRQAVWALGEIESAEAVPALIPILRDPDTEMRKQAAWALGEIESADAVAALSAATKDSDAEVREQAVWALGEIESSRGLPALTAALTDPEVEVRRKAVWAIGEIDDLRSAPPGLIAALRDSDTEVRKAAAEAVGQLEDQAAVPGLIPLTRDGNPEVKRAAVEALANIGGVQAVEAIVALLKDDDPEIRKLAAEALGRNR